MCPVLELYLFWDGGNRPVVVVPFRQDCQANRRGGGGTQVHCLRDSSALHTGPKKPKVGCPSGAAQERDGAGYKRCQM